MSLPVRLLWAIDPETAHNLTIRFLKAAPRSSLRAMRPGKVSTALKTELCGMQLAHPIGLAAGFDKDAQAYDALFDLGFSFVEVGTVTPKPQAGNPRPRLFRLTEDEAVINRFGFNNAGLDPLCARLASHPPRGTLGVNIGRNKSQTDAVADYVEGIRRASALARYITVNISSPNTPGLRDLQSGNALADLLSAISAARLSSAAKSPVFLKIAPDLEQADLENIVETAAGNQFDGLIVGNTTVDRPASLQNTNKNEAGGLSGKPLMSKSTALLRDAARLAKGRLALIGVGGISSPEDAYAKIKAGASALQLYTAFAYQGPALLERLLSGLDKCLHADGLESIREACGADVR